MKKMDNKEDLYSKFNQLKKQLKEQEWPSVYMFKFICPSDSETLAKVTALFSGQENISFRASRNGNYTSVSAKELMLNPEEIIDIYVKAAQIKGVITL